MQSQNNKSLSFAYGSWDCLLPLLKRERTTSLAELLMLTTVAEQSFSGPSVSLDRLRADDLQVT